MPITTTFVECHGYDATPDFVYAVSLLAGFAAALYAMSPECSHDDFLDGCQKKVTGGITSLELAPRRDSIVIIAVDGNMRSPTVGLFGSRGAFKLTIEQL